MAKNFINLLALSKQKMSRTKLIYLLKCHWQGERSNQNPEKIDPIRDGARKNSWGDGVRSRAAE